MAGDFTFGIEEEYFLVDARTKRAVRSMPETFFKAANAATDGRISREFLQAQIEVITSPHARMADARAELKHLRHAMLYCLAGHAAGSHNDTIFPNTGPHWNTRHLTDFFGTAAYTVGRTHLFYTPCNGQAIPRP